MANQFKKIGVQLEKEKLGKKWICPTTGKKFYDLNKEPVISPYTGEQLEIISIENSEKEKTEEIILENDDKKTSEVSETDEVKDDDNVDSDIEILNDNDEESITEIEDCLLYTSPSPRDRTRSRMPSSA